ncbi:hypothetical protein BOX15_Mlig032545g1 [Macrostomum lignano]|uniref:Gamma-tubulin complex component n=1 Tax=Macrostomum lignano TaxID=282301 RepID=A0A267H4R0_9PLAT|nr:hypothetical protein BOX15_Mlig032545g1 [Macrostomum lignano]
MLHELLLALYGCPGSVIQQTQSGSLRLIDNLPFISPSEVPLINRLCQLGAHYIRFQDFIAERSSYLDSDKPTAGLYAKVFSDALDNCLETYRARLVDLESELIADPYLSLNYVQCRLEEFQLLFPALSDLLESIERSNARGTQLMEKIVHRMPCGLPSAQSAFDALLQRCNRLAYRQIGDWMLQGTLDDPYSEFFVRLVDQKQQQQEQQKKPTAAVPGAPNATTAAADTSSIIVSTGAQKAELQFSLLPAYLPLTLAQRILFVGEAVRCFGLNESRSSAFLAELERLFLPRLETLADASQFDLLALEEFVADVRSHVTEQLWRLLMEDYSLEQQLQAVKDFYLMGRGEFYLAFIDLAGPLLDKPPHRMLGQQLRACFERAARAVGLEDDQALKQFDVWFDDSQAAAAGAGGSASDADSWSRVGLKFKHGWPFHLLFNDDILARYCQVFRFLLTVKRVQLTLQRSWAAQMIAKRGCRNSRVNSAALSKLEPHFLQRSRMQHAVDNLVYYLQVDVIDSRFNALITAARTQRDVEQLQVSHDQFVTALTAQSFLHNRPVRACVTQLLHSCLEFAGLLRNSLDSQRVDLDSLLQRMTALGQDFHRQTWHLLGMLTGLQAQSTTYLNQLLLRLDFNRFFSTAKPAALIPLPPHLGQTDAT